jgi:hypothetical protein
MLTPLAILLCAEANKITTKKNIPTGTAAGKQQVAHLRAEIFIYEHRHTSSKVNSCSRFATLSLSQRELQK